MPGFLHWPRPLAILVEPLQHGFESGKTARNMAGTDENPPKRFQVFPASGIRKMSQAR